MRELAPGTDRWGADVTPGAVGDWVYWVEAWSDPVTTWRRAAGIKIPAGIDVGLVLEEGAELYERAASGVPHEAGRAAVLTAVDALRDESRPPIARLAAALTPDVDTALADHPLRDRVSRSAPLPLLVERERALYGSWYEFFPRSEGAVVEDGKPPVTGTFRTAARRLPAIAEMGFDVVYLPPIHPIGTTFRKGPNNNLSAGRRDVGVPWAIGSPEGGHDAVHPDLGTIDDFDAFVRRGGAGISKSPWISRFSARRTTRGWRSTRSGSTTVPTARSRTPRIRRRSTRTSIRSPSTRTCRDWSPRPGGFCGSG
jgi:starch synthase (maltosyl-transferring)